MKFYATTMAVAAIIVCSLFAVPHEASAQSLTSVEWSEQCRSAWSESPAATSGYCEASRAFKLRSEDDDGAQGCGVFARCRITVAVGGMDRAFTPMVLADTRYSFADMSNLEFCFSPTHDFSNTRVDTWDGWIANIKPGCAVGDTSASSAVSNGLPARDPGE